MVPSNSEFPESWEGVRDGASVHLFLPWVQHLHTGSLQLAVAGDFTPQKLAEAADRGCSLPTFHPQRVVTHLPAHPGRTLSLRVNCRHVVGRILDTRTLRLNFSSPGRCMLAPGHVISTQRTPPSERGHSEQYFIAFLPL